jgi:hypothetical protein
MTHNEIIREISSLYPADEHETGKELLLEAICKCWRTLPEPILLEYWLLCQVEESKMT